MSDGTCLAADALKLAPSVRAWASSLSPPFESADRPFVPALSLGKSANTDTAKSGRGQPAPQGPSLRSGLFCPSPSTL